MCVWVCVCVFRMVGRMVAVKTNIPLAVRTAWPVCVLSFIRASVVESPCPCGLLENKGSQCWLSSHCVWAASRDGLLAASCCAMSLPVWRKSINEACFCYCHMSGTGIRHQIFPWRFGCFWDLRRSENFCSHLEQLPIMLNPIST